MVANHAEPTFALLRYSLGGNRPSKTDRLRTVPRLAYRLRLEFLINKEWCFTCDSTAPERPHFKVSHLR